MPELTRRRMEQRREAQKAFERELLEGLTEGAASTVAPHDLDTKIKGDALMERCFWCGQEQNYGAKELDGKYCRRNSISLARNNGTFDPDYEIE